jgi:hypothetical protein
MTAEKHNNSREVQTPANEKPYRVYLPDFDKDDFSGAEEHEAMKRATQSIIDAAKNFEFSHISALIEEIPENLQPPIIEEIFKYEPLVIIKALGEHLKEWRGWDKNVMARKLIESSAPDLIKQNASCFNDLNTEIAQALINNGYTEFVLQNKSLFDFGGHDERIEKLLENYIPPDGNSGLKYKTDEIQALLLDSSFCKNSKECGELLKKINKGKEISPKRFFGVFDTCSIVERIFLTRALLQSDQEELLKNFIERLSHTFRTFKSFESRGGWKDCVPILQDLTKTLIGKDDKRALFLEVVGLMLCRGESLKEELEELIKAAVLNGDEDLLVMLVEKGHGNLHFPDAVIKKLIDRGYEELIFSELGHLGLDDEDHEDTLNYLFKGALAKNKYRIVVDNLRPTYGRGGYLDNQIGEELLSKGYSKEVGRALHNFKEPSLLSASIAKANGISL